MSPRTYRRVVAVALALLCIIVVSGAAVRLTGSGLGCEDWPNCTSGDFIKISNPNQAIEQINRLFTGLVSVGVIAAVLDGAMTNYLFARGLQAVTGELTVRYRHPVAIGETVLVRAWLQESLPPLHLLQAELQRDGCVRASATAKFMERHE